MLSFLHIENVALIKQLDIDFEKGFNVLTGETGSGKSMIIDSLNMVLGQRAPKDIIRHGETECYIYAVFDSISDECASAMAEDGITPEEDGTVMLSRRLGSDGKSVFKINRRTVPVSIIKNIAARLISVNEQHDSYSLLNDAAHVDYLDAYTTSVVADHSTTLSEYAVAMKEYTNAKRQYDEHIEKADGREARLEFLRYQKKEIDSAKLKPGEEEELLREKEKIKNSELIVNAVRGTLALLSGGTKPGAYDKVSGAYDNIEKIKDLIADGEAVYNRLGNILSEIEDVTKAVSGIDTGIYDDPTSELDRIESRLDLISRLENKYGETVEQIIEYNESITNEISDLEQYDFALAEYDAKVKDALEKVMRSARKLRAEREAGAEKLTAAINRELLFLDMEKVLFKVNFQPLDMPTAQGIDDVSFFIRTNPGEPFKSLSTVSSGGELSRIMLSLKTVLSGCDGVGTVVFDEIDTGVSGKTSSKIGISLKTLSKSRQVICITHSAQVSAIAEHHLKISKTEANGRTFASVTLLEGKDRIEEIARILGGVTITDSVIKTAEELIQQGINN